MAKLILITDSPELVDELAKTVFALGSVEHILGCVPRSFPPSPDCWEQLQREATSRFNAVPKADATAESRPVTDVKIESVKARKPSK